MARSTIVEVVNLIDSYDKEEYIDKRSVKIKQDYDKLTREYYIQTHEDVEIRGFFEALLSRDISRIHEHNIIDFVSCVDLFVDEIFLNFYLDRYKFFIIQIIFTVIFISLKMDISELSYILDSFKKKSENFQVFKEKLLELLLIYLKFKNISDFLERFTDIYFFIVSLYLQFKYYTDVKHDEREEKKMGFLGNYTTLFNELYKRKKTKINEFKTSLPIITIQQLLSILHKNYSLDLSNCIGILTEKSDRNLTERELYTILFFVTEFTDEFVFYSPLYRQNEPLKLKALSIFYKVFFMMFLIYKEEDYTDEQSCLNKLSSLEKIMIKRRKKYDEMYLILNKLFHVYLKNTSLKFIGGLNHYRNILFFIYLLRFSFEDDAEDDADADADDEDGISSRGQSRGQSRREDNPINLTDIHLKITGGKKKKKILRKYK